MGEVREVRSPDGTVLGVEVVGAGPPLVLVHGGTADRSRWAPVVGPLAERFTLHLLDRRGRGASTREADGPYALEREAEDVIAVAEAAGSPVRLLGHSYGGLIALELLRLLPAVLERALLYEPAFDTAGHSIAPAYAVDAVKEQLAAGDREGALITFYERVVGIDPAPLMRLPVWQARIAAVHTVVREAEIGLRYALDPAPLADVRVPVRVLAGTTSPPAFGAAAELTAKAVPGAELVWLEGQGHTMIDADPAGFVDQVVDFLA
jgi:pimeloyl-ACP methyl ester carboxylesterase